MYNIDYCPVLDGKKCLYSLQQFFYKNAICYIKGNENHAAEVNENLKLFSDAFFLHLYKEKYIEFRSFDKTKNFIFLKTSVKYLRGVNEKPARERPTATLMNKKMCNAFNKYFQDFLKKKKDAPPSPTSPE